MPFNSPSKISFADEAPAADAPAADAPAADAPAADAAAGDAPAEGGEAGGNSTAADNPNAVKTVTEGWLRVSATSFSVLKNLTKGPNEIPRDANFIL